MARTLLAAGNTGTDKVQIVFCKIGSASRTVRVIGIAAVDNDVARFEQWQQQFLKASQGMFPKFPPKS